MLRLQVENAFRFAQECRMDYRWQYMGQDEVIIYAWFKFEIYLPAVVGQKVWWSVAPDFTSQRTLIFDSDVRLLVCVF